ncbi:MAG TPA: class I SAM-dependent methyltransferase, partial [Acidimicrobiales bacterium]|nr:class I SAM-dependent methyltransferase [Acidimicrobiales bacterium]
TVEADSRDLPDSLAGRFDLVYSTIGVLCWIDDVDAWMASVVRSLRPGGALVLVELHPLLTAVDSIGPLVIDFPYGFDGPHVYSGTGSYAGVETEPWTTVQYGHSLGEVVTAALDAGLVVERLEEHLSMAFDPRALGAPVEADGRYRLRLGSGSATDPTAVAPPLPVLYTLIARSPD